MFGSDENKKSFIAEYEKSVNVLNIEVNGDFESLDSNFQFSWNLSMILKWSRLLLFSLIPKTKNTLGFLPASKESF